MMANRGGRIGFKRGGKVDEESPAHEKTESAAKERSEHPGKASGGGLSYSAKDAAAGKDIGKPGKMFGKIASKSGGGEKGNKIAGAVLKNLRGG